MSNRIEIILHNLTAKTTRKGVVSPNATVRGFKRVISQMVENQLPVILYFDKKELSNDAEKIGDIIRNSSGVTTEPPLFEFTNEAPRPNNRSGYPTLNAASAPPLGKRRAPRRPKKSSDPNLNAAIAASLANAPRLPEQPPQEPLTEEQMDIFDSEHIETLPLLNAHIGQIFKNRLGDERENTFYTTPESNLGTKMNNNTDEILQQCKTMYSSGNNNDCLIHSFLTVYCPNFRRLSMKDKNVVAHNFRIYVYPNTDNYISNKRLDDLVYDFIKREGRKTNEDDFFNIERLEAEAAKAAGEAANDARHVRRNVLHVRAVNTSKALREAHARILGIRSPYRKGQYISFEEVKKYIASIRRALESPNSKETDYNIERRVKEPVYLTDKDLSNLCQDYNCTCITFSRSDNICASVGTNNDDNGISMIYNSGGHYEGVRYGEPPETTYIIEKGLATYFKQLFTLRLPGNNANRRPPNAAPNAANVLRNMRLAPEEKWRCNFCTLDNPNSRENCEACGALRPSDPKRILTEPIIQFEEKYREQIRNRFFNFRPQTIRAFENVETFLFYLNITPEDFIEEIKKTGDTTYRIPDDIYYLDDYIRLSKATGVPFINMINIGRIIMIKNPHDWSTIDSKGYLLLTHLKSEEYEQRVKSKGVALPSVNNIQRKYDNMLEKIQKINVRVKKFYPNRRGINPFLTVEQLESIVYPETTGGGARTRRKLRGRKSRGTRRKS